MGSQTARATRAYTGKAHAHAKKQLKIAEEEGYESDRKWQNLTKLSYTMTLADYCALPHATPVPTICQRKMSRLTSTAISPRLQRILSYFHIFSYWCTPNSCVFFSNQKSIIWNVFDTTSKQFLITLCAYRFWVRRRAIRWIWASCYRKKKRHACTFYELFFRTGCAPASCTQALNASWLSLRDFGRLRCGFSNKWTGSRMAWQDLRNTRSMITRSSKVRYLWHLF